jgi:hypothetical protein
LGGVLRINSSAVAISLAMAENVAASRDLATRMLVVALEAVERDGR